MDNVNTQVVERHIVYDLESIFSPIIVSAWRSKELMTVASKPPAILRQREFNEGRRRMFKEGITVFIQLLHGGE